MQDSSTGDRRIVSSAASSSGRTEILRIEHAVWTRAEPEIAWEMFTDWKNWHRISDRYQAIEWSGTPWSRSSRLRVELLHPFRTAVDRVITVSEPGECLAWINHVMGYTMEQWLVFQSIADGTRIATWLEFTGPEATIEGRSVRDIIQEYLSEWYESFRLECDRAAVAS